MIVNNKLGGRTVELYIPFEHGGKVIDKITLSPFRFGDTLSWGDGVYQSSLALMTMLSGEDEAVIRGIRYPDADRVFEAFIGLLPPDIRDDIANGRVPVPKDKIVTNGSGAAVEEPEEELLPRMPLAREKAPGVPLPEAGFDLSEEE